MYCVVGAGTARLPKNKPTFGFIGTTVTDAYAICNTEIYSPEQAFHRFLYCGVEYIKINLDKCWQRSYKELV